MHDPDSENTATPPVSDRRRFDMNGNPRDDDGAQAASPAQQSPAEDAERQRLMDELAASRKRVDELARAYQALSQDREEFKQRLTRERERMLDVERGKVATTLLEAIDDLDRSLAASESDASPLAQGVRLIREGLLAKVQSAGIERIDVVGKPFDPNTAEATDMELTPVPEDDHKVVSEVRAGYRLGERVIRPARVRVAKYVPPAQA
jgi:molecular chaperone GrpE